MDYFYHTYIHMTSHFPGAVVVVIGW